MAMELNPELDPEPNLPPVAASQAAVLRRALRSPLARNRAALAGLIILIPMLVMVFFPSLLAGDPNAQDLSQSLQPPSAEHILGTDKLGRDVWARIVYGARPTLLGAFVVIVISGVIGIPLGLMAGFYGGRLDFAVMRVLDALLAFPALLLAILVVATFGSGLGTVVVALGIIYVPAMARLVRSVTLVHSRLAYVDAGRALGFSNRRIMLGHILPNLVAAIVVQSTIDLAYAILDIAALSFLGLGQQPPDPDWGSMLADARSYLLQDPWPAVSAGVAIALAVVSVNLVGDGLRSQLDPRERER